MNVKESVTIDIANLLGTGNITAKESVVLSLLMLNWGKDKIKQKDIILHPSWRVQSFGNPSTESEMRGLRRVIRKLRVVHGIPIIHSSEGHYLPETQDEVDEFMSRFKREVTRHTSSSFETYQVMKESLGATSLLLDRMTISGVNVVSYEKV